MSSTSTRACRWTWASPTRRGRPSPRPSHCSSLRATSAGCRWSPTSGASTRRLSATTRTRVQQGSGHAPMRDGPARRVSRRSPRHTLDFVARVGDRRARSRRGRASTRARPRAPAGCRADALGSPYARVTAYTNIAAPLLELGRLDEASTYVRHAIQLGRGHGFALPYAAMTAARVASQLGRHEVAVRILGPCLDDLSAKSVELQAYSVTEVDVIYASARAELGAERFAAAERAARRTSLDQAIELALGLERRRLRRCRLAVRWSDQPSVRERRASAATCPAGTVGARADGDLDAFRRRPSVLDRDASLSTR